MMEDPFGEKVSFHTNNLKRKPRSRKSSRSPINPIDLKNFKSVGLNSRDLGSDICSSHNGINGISSNTVRKHSDIGYQRKPSAKTPQEGKRLGFGASNTKTRPIRKVSPILRNRQAGKKSSSGLFFSENLVS